MKQRLILVSLFALIAFNVSGNNKIEPSEDIEPSEEEVRQASRNRLIEHMPKDTTQQHYGGSHPAPVQNIKWSPDNVHFATLAEYGKGDDNLVRIFNSKTGALIHGAGSGKEIKDFAWAPDGNRIAITHHFVDLYIEDLTKVYELKQKMAKLSSDDLSFIALFYGEKPLTELTQEQQKKLNKFPAVIKNSLMETLEDNKEGVQPNPLRS